MKYLVLFLKFSLIQTIVFFLLLVAGLWYIGEIKINKTVGWASDINNSIFFILPLGLFYVSLHITTFIFKLKTNVYFTILSIASLLSCYFIRYDLLLYIILFGFSITLFASNIIYSLWSKAKTK